MTTALTACALSLILGGCTPWTTRYPTTLTSEPNSERLSFQHFDPLSSIEAGPDLMIRPREYMTPRTIERTGAQDRVINQLRPRQQPYFPAYSQPPQPPPFGY